MREPWLDLVARELSVDADVEAGPLLQTARDVAHNVERKATPLTTFLIGVAIGRAGTDGDLSVLCERVSELARAWESSSDADGRRG